MKQRFLSHSLVTWAQPRDSIEWIGDDEYMRISFFVCGARAKGKWYWQTWRRRRRRNMMRRKHWKHCHNAHNVALVYVIDATHNSKHINRTTCARRQMCANAIFVFIHSFSSLLFQNFLLLIVWLLLKKKKVFFFLSIWYFCLFLFDHWIIHENEMEN